MTEKVMTLETLNQNMQVKKARTEITRKPIVPPPQTQLPDNLCIRTQSKTKVSTGSRRNNIIGYVPRTARQEVVAPPLTNLLQTALPNNGHATLPSIPLIDEDVIPCFNGGLPMLDIQNGQNAKYANGVNDHTKVRVAKAPSTTSATPKSFHKNGLPSLASSNSSINSYSSASSTLPNGATNNSSAIYHLQRQQNEKSSFNNNASTLSKKEKSSYKNGLSQSKTKDKKPSNHANSSMSSIPSAKKEKKSIPQKPSFSSKNGLPNLLDDEFGFGRNNLSESSSDETEDDPIEPAVSYNEFGLPILTGNSDGAFKNNPETNYKNNNHNYTNGSASSSSITKMKDNYNNQDYYCQSKSSYNSKDSKEKNVNNFKNNYNSNNYSNINNNNMKREPVITKESNFRNELNFNKETITAQKRHSANISAQDQDLSSTKKKKKEESSNATNNNDISIKKEKKEKKDKNKKSEKDKKKKNKDSTGSVKEHSPKLTSYETNNQKNESSSKYNNFKPQQLNKESARVNYSNCKPNYENNDFNNVSNGPSFPNAKTSNYNNTSNGNVGHKNQSLPDLTILIDDDDSNHASNGMVQNSSNYKNMPLSNGNGFGGFEGLPDLSCAINNDLINQTNPKSSFSLHEKSRDKKQKGVTKERYGSRKNIDIYSSSASPTITPPTQITNYNMNSTDSHKHKVEFEQQKPFNQDGQTNYPRYNNFNQEYYKSQSPKSNQPNTQMQYQNLNADFTNAFNDNYQQNLNYNGNSENNFGLESNNKYYNDGVNLNTKTNEFIGLAAIKSDDHLNSRGTSESEVGILSSSDSSSSDSDSSSSDSDSDGETQRNSLNTNKKLYQSNLNTQPQQQQPPHVQQQYAANNYEPSSYYNSNQNSQPYQAQTNGSAYNPNHVAFLHNDLRLSESDSSDSEL